MPQRLSAAETAILATFPNRQDAEVVKARLDDHEIDALVVAEDVHPPFQLTGGVELRVLKKQADRARHVLGANTSVSATGGTGAEMLRESTGRRNAQP